MQYFWIDKSLTNEDFEYTINRCYTSYMQQTNDVLFNLLDSHDTKRLRSDVKNLDEYYSNTAFQWHFDTKNKTIRQERKMASYELLKQEGRAKRGIFHTVHGDIQTPVFMNVGTIGAIKGAVSTEDLKEIHCQVELSNTYHLHVRPGTS